MLKGEEVFIAAKRPFIGYMLGLFVEKERLGEPSRIINDGVQTLSLVVKNTPSVMLLDLFMPNLGGVNILHRLKSQEINIPILCFCNTLNKRYGVIAVKAGALGIIDFNEDAETFAKAIDKVQRGRRFIPEDIQALLDSRDYELCPENYRGLTERQAECLEMIGYGLSHEEICDRMGVCKQMVSKYKKQIADKLGVSSSQEIAIYAMRNGFVEIEEDNECLLNPLPRRPRGSRNQPKESSDS